MSLMPTESRRVLRLSLASLNECKRRKCQGCLLCLTAAENADRIIAEFSRPFRAAEAGA